MENNNPDYSKKNKGALYVTFGNLEFTTLCVLVSVFFYGTQFQIEKRNIFS